MQPVLTWTYRLFILFGLLIAFPTYGQFSSFEKRRTTVDPERVRIQTEIDSAKNLFTTDRIAAFEKVEAAITAAVKSGYRPELAEAYYTLGNFNFSMLEYNSAVLYFDRALSIYKSLSSWEMVYNIQMLLGKSYINLAEYNMAQTQFDEAALIALKGKRTAGNLKARIASAQLLIMKENFDLAEAQLNEVRAEAQAANLTEIAAEAEYELGEIFEKRGDFYQANSYFGYAQDNALQTRNNPLLLKTNQRVVENYTKTDDKNIGLDDQKLFNSLNRAETVFLDEKDTVALLENTIQKADYYAAQGEYNEAEQALNNSLDLSEQYGDLDKQVTTQKKLYDIYAQSNQAKEAMEAYDNYQMLLDSAKQLKEAEKGQNDQQQFALKTVERQIEVLEKERQLNLQTIALLEKETALNNNALEQQRTLLYVFGFILVVFLGVSILVYRNTKAKKRAHQLLYLKSLRAQMNPHFIFNSLNSVNNYIAKSNERAANRYLSKFSRLMRQVLEHSQVEFISLTNEIEVLRLYVELEHERFKDKFDFTFEVDDMINTDSFNIPPMLVQPFIENAVWHGLRYKESGGHLTVLFESEDDHVLITVADNGIGRQKSKELKTINQKKHNSSGMRNVENRTEMIQAVFKTKIDYQIIDLPDHTGTKVLIKLYRNDKEG